MSHKYKWNFFLMDKLKLKLYTVAVYNLSMCIKEDNHGPKHFKGDN